LLVFAAARELHCGAHLHPDTTDRLTDRPTDRHSNALFALIMHELMMTPMQMLMMMFTVTSPDVRARSPAR
jgi:hypothetical protein